MMRFDEQKLIVIAEPYFKTARAGDWKHALRAVKWVKNLGRGRKDLYLIITAAYLHDIGWSGVAPKGKLRLDKILRLEPKANKNSFKLVSEVCRKYGFNNTETLIIGRLILAADKHKSKNKDESILVDADNLSKLCKENLFEKYQPGSFAEVIKLWENESRARIKTDKGRKMFPKLIADLKCRFNV